MLGSSGAYFVPQLAGVLAGGPGTGPGTEMDGGPTVPAVLRGPVGTVLGLRGRPPTPWPPSANCSPAARPRTACRPWPRAPGPPGPGAWRCCAPPIRRLPVELPGRRPQPDAAAGRWAALPAPLQDTTIRAHAAAEFLLERYGVVTRGSVAAESVPGGFGQLYRVLGRLEEAGHARRGYFIERLGPHSSPPPPPSTGCARWCANPGTGQLPIALGLAATDPANPYGAALGWPESAGGHRPGRKAGALVVLLDGALALYVERGGKTVLGFGAAAQAAGGGRPRCGGA